MPVVGKLFSGIVQARLGRAFRDPELFCRVTDRHLEFVHETKHSPLFLGQAAQEVLHLLVLLGLFERGVGAQRRDVDHPGRNEVPFALIPLVLDLERRFAAAVMVEQLEGVYERVLEDGGWS